MDYVVVLVIALPFIIVVIGVGVHFIDIVRIGFMAIAPDALRRFVHRHMLIWPLKDKYKKHLERGSSFYRSLDSKEKRSFEKRVQRFIDSHQFISRGSGSRPVSPERISRIAAVATELTYGLPHIYFEYFDRILVYEDDYYSTITKKWHQGEVNARGFIVLSWMNFMRGAEDQDDGVHLGFHEMAHALQLEDHLETSNYAFFDKKKLSRLQSIGNGLYLKESDTFFRPSALNDRFEFFAVVVESFFERPKELKRAYPEIHELLADLLRHDPIGYLNRGTSAVRFN